jgi:PhnB protein
MRLNAHLVFNGDCRDAFEYYEKHLGGKIGFIMTYGESPMATQTAPEQHAKILHASLTIGNELLTGADAPPSAYQKPQGNSLLFSVDDAAEADRIFQTLAENGTVQMPVQETFWALRFGMLVDRFGTPWMINCSRPA